MYQPFNGFLAFFSVVASIQIYPLSNDGAKVRKKNGEMKKIKQKFVPLPE
jgi:hypothetical protein